MSQSLYSFDGLPSLLARAGIGTGRATATRQVIAPTIDPPKDLVAIVKAVKVPSQRALGAALESLLGDLSRVLELSLFVADGDGLLLAGSGDAPAMAASLAADVMHSLREGSSFTATQVDGLLLKVPPQDYLVFSRREGKRGFVVGARVGEKVPLKALRAAAELIWDTLFMRTQYA